MKKFKSFSEVNEAKKYTDPDKKLLADEMADEILKLLDENPPIVAHEKFKHSLHDKGNLSWDKVERIHKLIYNNRNRNKLKQQVKDLVYNEI